MAAGDLYIECEGGGKKLVGSSAALEILNALVVKTVAGKYGFRTVTITTAAGNISPVLNCGEPLMDLDTLLKWVVVESASGQPAIGLIAES